MSYTDYLNRKKINTPQVIDTQMRLPDASSFTWRTKMAATSVLPSSTHVINNSQDTPAPRLFSPAVMSYPGNGLGGKVQDASTFTLSRGARALGNDNFNLGRIVTVTRNSAGNCLTTTPASQVVNTNGNAEGSSAGLNMGYRDHTVNGVVRANEVGVCTHRFFPLTVSHFVDTIPDLKTHKIGTSLVNNGSRLGLDRAQNPITRCTTTNTSGEIKGTSRDSNGINLPVPKSDVPYNSYSARPFNPERGAFITGIQGPQVGGAELPGGRADKVGGAVPRVNHAINHRGWAGRTRNPYPRQFVPPNNAPAHLKINDATHYKNGSS
jgi:hypothetical protein